MVKNFMKLNQTWYGVSHVCLKFRLKRIFALACVGKKLGFHTEICDYFKYVILKIGLFD